MTPEIIAIVMVGVALAGVSIDSSATCRPRTSRLSP